MSNGPPDLKALRILVVDDEESIRFALTACLELDGHRVVARGTAEAAVAEAARQVFDLIFLDVRLGMQNGIDHIPALLAASPWARVVVITAYASIETAVDAMKAGATDYLAKPFDNAQLRMVTRKVAERRQLERKVDALELALGRMDPEADLPTASPAWRESIELARRVAPTSVAVLIRGEPGTGRGRVARAVHAWSRRAPGPFAAVCCRGKSVDQLEAELFGGDDGDATVNAGAVTFCHGGTLLLEEVADLPMRLQPRVVALIRDREFERPGSALRRAVDVRVVATTSADPYAAVQAGRLREDLLSALTVVQVLVPPLRQRSEDVPLLAELYLAHFAREHHRTATRFGRDALAALAAHDWPGNTRELRNVVERAVLRCDAGPVIDLAHLPPDLLVPAEVDPATVPADDDHRLGDPVPLDVIEGSHIRRVLASAKTIRRAADILGINASTLCRKLKRYRLEGMTEHRPG